MPAVIDSVLSIVGIQWFSSNQVPHPPMWSSFQISSVLHSVSVSKTYKAPQCLLVICWLHGWALATWAYPTVQHSNVQIRKIQRHSWGTWYTGGMICLSGVVVAHSGMPCGDPPSDISTTESGLQGTKSLCSRERGGGVSARVPVISTSDSPSGVVCAKFNKIVFTVHSGLRMRPSPANVSTTSFSASTEGQGT